MEQITNYPKPGQRVQFIGCDPLHFGRTGKVQDLHLHPSRGEVVVNLILDSTEHGCMFIGFEARVFVPA